MTTVPTDVETALARVPLFHRVDPTALVALARECGGHPQADGERVEIAVDDALLARSILDAHGDSVRDFEFRHGRMDDVFLALTGRSADAAEDSDGEAA